LFVFFFSVFGFGVFCVLGIGFWDFDCVHGVAGVPALVASTQVASWEFSIGAGGIGVGFDGCVHSFFFLLLLTEVLLSGLLLLLLLLLFHPPALLSWF
jgi:hypothetical protein